MKSDLDLVLFGATGFTGRLVAEVLGRRLTGSPLRWALAGRQLQKLKAMRDALGLDDAVELIAVNAADSAGLADMASRTRVVISTVGPYQQYGGPLVQACAATGADYVDLCGEPVWMAEMLALLQDPAKRSGARIVFSCGFDSIPFDLGVVFLQQQAQQRFGQPMPQVSCRVEAMKGGFSGGTAASLLATLAAIDERPERARVMGDPFALTPGFAGPAQPEPGTRAKFDPVAGEWTAPFLMAPINTKNVHRTNALRGHPWGQGFLYDERVLCGAASAGRWRASALAGAARAQQMMLGMSVARALARRWVLPSPGQGPDAQQREAGHFRLRLWGRDSSTGHRLSVSIRGQRDPGYGATSRMISEAALCLLEDIDRQHTPGGVWTPGAAMGLALVRRLQAHAGLQFELLP